MNAPEHRAPVAPNGLPSDERQPNDNGVSSEWWSVMLPELKVALLRIGRTHPDTELVMHAACDMLNELAAMRSEMKVRATAARSQLSRGDSDEVMRLLASIEKIAGSPSRRFPITFSEEVRKPEVRNVVRSENAVSERPVTEACNS
tara:strand:+ start:2130 stop:2567 length:438 start_codon:yes stop_codon:yes gene_type:complete